MQVLSENALQLNGKRKSAPGQIFCKGVPDFTKANKALCGVNRPRLFERSSELKATQSRDALESIVLRCYGEISALTLPPWWQAWESQVFNLCESVWSYGVRMGRYMGISCSKGSCESVPHSESRDDSVI
jgi:hypothetical protein